MIDPRILANLVTYDPQTGAIIWRQREVSAFKSERDWKIWNTKNASRPAFSSPHIGGYLCGRVFGKSYLAHRVAWAVYFGEWPADEIDHINGDRTDNRICNLRDVSRTENARNCALRKDNTSGHVGVHFNKRNKTWAATVGGDHIGTFNSKEEAQKARSEASDCFTARHGKPDCDSIRMEEL